MVRNFFNGNIRENRLIRDFNSQQNDVSQKEKNILTKVKCDQDILPRKYLIKFMMLLNLFDD